MDQISIFRHLLLQKIILYLNAAIDKFELERFFFANLRRLIASGDQELTHLADLIDVALLHLDEEIISEEEFASQLRDIMLLMGQNNQPDSKPFQYNIVPGDILITDNPNQGNPLMSPSGLWEVSFFPFKRETDTIV